jgi:hypothetical protein
VTLDPRRPVARAIAIGGGRGLALGAGRALRHLAHAATERIDCRGATVLPGLIDPHLHLVALAARRVNLDCSAADSVEAVLAGVRARAAMLPRDAWVRGEGVDEARLGRLPSAGELERAGGGRPVRLRHRSRHASVLGPRALRLLGDGRGVERRAGVATGCLGARGRARPPRRPAARRRARRRARGGGARARGARRDVGRGRDAAHGTRPGAARRVARRFPLRVAAMRPPGRARGARPRGSSRRREDDGRGDGRRPGRTRQSSPAGSPPPRRPATRSRSTASAPRRSSPRSPPSRPCRRRTGTDAATGSSTSANARPRSSLRSPRSASRS